MDTFTGTATRRLLREPPRTFSGAVSRVSRASDLRVARTARSRDRTTVPDPVARVLWSPPPDARERSRMGRYLAWLAAERGLAFADYDGRLALVGRRARARSGSRSGTTSGCARRRRPGPALADARMPGARWFPGATLNYAEHALALPGPRARRRRRSSPARRPRARST